MNEWPATPFYLFDERTLRERAAAARAVADAIDARLLYSVKACAVGGVVRKIAQFVDGFSCSSPFETYAAATFRSSKNQTLHFCAPAIRPADLNDLSVAADYVTLNSPSQWERFRENLMSAGVRCGLRLNPQLSFAGDLRYDPCRPNSKLGIVAEDLRQIAVDVPRLWDGVSGIHFHNNADGFDLAQLAQTIDAVEQLPRALLERLSWINIGGGYFLHNAIHTNALIDALRRLRARRTLEIFLEPGATFVRDAGFLISSVVDVFTSESRKIAVLDSTVNHYPNLLTYGSKATVASPTLGVGLRHVLAGITCLAGDLFGEFEFEKPLAVGDAVVLESVGAYGLVKMHMFNGVPLPDVYLRSDDGTLNLLNSGTYGDYVRVYVGD
jgi:carboxynorspermidine decarboxylase